MGDVELLQNRADVMMSPQRLVGLIPSAGVLGEEGIVTHHWLGLQWMKSVV